MGRGLVSAQIDFFRDACVAVCSLVRHHLAPKQSKAVMNGMSVPCMHRSWPARLAQQHTQLPLRWSRGEVGLVLVKACILDGLRRRWSCKRCGTLRLLQQGASQARCNCGCCLVGLSILDVVAGGLRGFGLSPVAAFLRRFWFSCRHSGATQDYIESHLMRLVVDEGLAGGGVRQCRATRSKGTLCCTTDLNRSGELPHRKPSMHTHAFLAWQLNSQVWCLPRH